MQAKVEQQAREVALRSVFSREQPKILWSRGQAVKTSPFHGGIRGSIPLGITKNRQVKTCRFFITSFKQDKISSIVF